MGDSAVSRARPEGSPAEATQSKGEITKDSFPWHRGSFGWMDDRVTLFTQQMHVLPRRGLSGAVSNYMDCEQTQQCRKSLSSRMKDCSPALSVSSIRLKPECHHNWGNTETWLPCPYLFRCTEHKPSKTENHALGFSFLNPLVLSRAHRTKGGSNREG